MTENPTHINASISEDHGIAALADADHQVYSMGVSTGGVAEIRMAQLNPGRHIIATTIDSEGVEFAKKIVEERHLSDQIELKLEDVSKSLPYPDGKFDFVYARLVLHYLAKQALEKALQELHRVLRPGGRIFVVVRSTDCPDAHREGAVFDPKTGLTTCTSTSESGKTYTYSRYFHTKKSISKYIRSAHFEIEDITSYNERLFVDFMRTKLAPTTDDVIEVLASK